MAQFLYTKFESFIDRPGVLDAVEKKFTRVFGLAGGFGRQVMKRGMRKRKGAAPAREYPNAHDGGLRNGIFFNYDKEKKELVVGPVRFERKNNPLSSGLQTVPQLVNEGGQAVFAQLLGYRDYKIGWGGPIRANGDGTFSYAKLRTGRQAERAKRLVEEENAIRTSGKLKVVRLKPHPFVELTKPKTIAKLKELTASIPLKR